MPPPEEVAPSLRTAQSMLASGIQEKSDILLPSPKIWMALGNMLLIGLLDRDKEIQSAMQLSKSQRSEKDCEHHSWFLVQILKTKLEMGIKYRTAPQLLETMYV